VIATDVTVLPRVELARLLAAGHPVDPAALAGADYRGTALGLPAFVERLTWKVFRKVFRHAAGGGVVGHNVRLDQRTQAPLLDRAGEPITFGPYRVSPLPANGMPFACRAGVLLDYGAARPALHPLARLRDPLVALNPGSVDLLLGATYLALGPLALKTPSFFVLERLG
jgi:hypothetical protein